jgi:hypothetical protein
MKHYEGWTDFSYVVRQEPPYYFGGVKFNTRTCFFRDFMGAFRTNTKIVEVRRPNTIRTAPQSLTPATGLWDFMRAGM